MKVFLVNGQILNVETATKVEDSVYWITLRSEDGTEVGKYKTSSVAGWSYVEATVVG